MAKNIITHLFCYDEHRGLCEDIRKRFADTARYNVISFNSKDDLIGHLDEKKDESYCKVAIIGIHDINDQFEMIDNLTMEIRKIDPMTGLILLCPVDKTDEIKKYVKFNIDAYIPKNANSILRIHNTVKKLISEHNIRFFRKKRNLSMYVLLAFILLSLSFLIAAYFRLPGYF